jgi:hypothetical protein
VQHLNRNTELNGNCFRCLHAVGGRSGGFVRVTAQAVRSRDMRAMDPLKFAF